jgi:hypothetical protein
MKQLSLREGFVLSVGHGARRRRMWRALTPDRAFLPFDLDLLDLMSGLDPGMIDWKPALGWSTV